MTRMAGKKQSLLSILRRKLYVLCNGLLHAFDLNCRMLIGKLTGKKTLVFHFCATTQLMHLEPVIKELSASPNFNRIRIYFLTTPAEIASLRMPIELIIPGALVHSVFAARFLLFCDCLLSVDLGMQYPRVGCRVRACSTHGQPSKGNTYKCFNYTQINTFFFYGPLMRDYYLEHKKNHPSWPKADCYDVGQPLSDSLFNNRMKKDEARRSLDLEPSRLTVLFAPSFEYCSSFATHGEKIIEALLHLDVNLIVKPHPAFYNQAPFRDEFNRNVPNVNDWRDKVRRYDSNPRCVFSEDNSLDSVKALYAADVMLTDYSGIAFDGILLDLAMIYWDCPLLYTEYLPKRYGIDGEIAKRDLACNVGRDAGIVVRDTDELANAIAAYHDNSQHKGPERKKIREQLLFNPGCATKAMARKIEELIGICEA